MDFKEHDLKARREHRNEVGMMLYWEDVLQKSNLLNRRNYHHT
jgi:hypothetical protein